MKFQGCFHGGHDSVALNVISAADRLGGKDPLSAGILPEVIDATLILPFNDLEAVQRAASEHRGEIAAIILEPIPHNIGAVLPEPSFLQGLRTVCDREGIVLVFDEVITGFRHGLAGYQGIAGVTPDLTALGKAMANGFPIAALAGRADLLEELSTVPGGPVMLAGTYNGHPGPAAAALATIEKLEREPVHEHVFRLGERARTELQAMFDRIGVEAFVTGFGSVWVTYFQRGPVRSYDDLLRNDAELFVGYRRRLLERGIFELPANLKRNHISYAHTDDHVDRLVAATEWAVLAELDAREVSESGRAGSARRTARSGAGHSRRKDVNEAPTELHRSPRSDRRRECRRHGVGLGGADQHRDGGDLRQVGEVRHGDLQVRPDEEPRHEVQGRAHEGGEALQGRLGHAGHRASRSRSC